MRELTKKIFCFALALISISCGEQAAKPVLINGAGATFPYPIYSKWFDEYHKLHPEIQINYASVGSGAGIRQMLVSTVDFGASDGPMTDEQLAQANVPILHFPTVLGADVATYNIPGVQQELNFTPEAIAGIFLGKITKWNDPLIARENPGIKLPDAGIVVIHRSDGSGTTYIWTDYLSKISSEWKEKIGKETSVNWPVGLGAKGNEGVSGLIKQTPNSIGYVELVYAIQNHLPYARVRNAAGAFVKADLATISTAAAETATSMPDDFRVSITNPPGQEAYPVASFTWLLIPGKITDAAKREAIKSFLRWMLTEGQKFAEDLAYGKLPPDVVEKEMEAISMIQ
ncbi:MAG: phosphate ABC transporter substrate-binding protein PstS [Acidobacteria bacterium]|nr:phosphate ABC transporter substrate-binding protein PstS [Acidobacteriota bacterium]